MNDTSKKSNTEKRSTNTGKAPLLVTCSSDRGLCGGIHSALTKATKRAIVANPEAKIAVLGLKCRTQLQRTLRPSIAMTFDGVTKFNVGWFETALIGDLVLKQGIVVLP
jgi:F-type H+-transporting ATPase subunit gamma